ncbi:MAG: hypothetical protein KGD66_08175 [Candidatus Lokiarchaeota archaeon]|nr:hypothetical protein [Candidatus Lokiarchaeota archaeon]
METEYNKESSNQSIASESNDNLIKVRAIISCPTCTYQKKFKNQFSRKELELFVVTAKIFDWMVCTKCGDLLNLTFEFDI